MSFRSVLIDARGGTRRGKKYRLVPFGMTESSVARLWRLSKEDGEVNSLPGRGVNSTSKIRPEGRGRDLSRPYDGARLRSLVKGSGRGSAWLGTGGGGGLAGDYDKVPREGFYPRRSFPLEKFLDVLFACFAMACKRTVCSRPRGFSGGGTYI